MLKIKGVTQAIFIAGVCGILYPAVFRCLGFPKCYDAGRHRSKTVVALDAGPTAALRPVITLDRTPVARVRIDLQAGPGAVALLAYIAVAVAGLAGLEVAARFNGMVRGPDMGGELAVGMTQLAL